MVCWHSNTGTVPKLSKCMCCCGCYIMSLHVSWHCCIHQLPYWKILSTIFDLFCGDIYSLHASNLENEANICYAKMSARLWNTVRLSDGQTTHQNFLKIDAAAAVAAHELIRPLDHHAMWALSQGHVYIATTSRNLNGGDLCSDGVKNCGDWGPPLPLSTFIP